MTTPNDTTTNTVLQQAVQRQLITIRYSYGTPALKKRDKKLQSEVTTSHQAGANAAEVYRNIWAGAEEIIKTAKKPADKARNELYQVAPPYSVIGPEELAAGHSAKGPRIMEADAGHQMVATLMQVKRQFETAADDAKANYEQAKAKARATAGNLDPIDYPSAEEFRSKFWMSVAVEPIPLGSLLGTTGVVGSAARAAGDLMAEQTRARFQTALDHATQELASYLSGSLAKVCRNKAGGERTHVRAGLLDRLEGFCMAVHTANIFGDPKLDKVVEILTQARTRVSVESLRSDPAQATQLAGIAEKCASILSGALSGTLTAVRPDPAVREPEHPIVAPGASDAPGSPDPALQAGAEGASEAPGPEQGVPELARQGYSAEDVDEAAQAVEEVGEDELERYAEESQDEYELVGGMVTIDE